MRFRNLEPPYEPQSMGAVLKWALVDRVAGRRRRAPRRAEMPRVAPDLTRIGQDAPSLTWVGHATWLACLAGQRVVTDPVWSTSIGPGITRNVPPGVALEQAAPTVVLVSHNHRDHLDAPTIERIGGEAIYVVPQGMGRFFRKRGFAHVHEVEWWQAVTIGELTVTFVPSQHWSQRGPLDRNESLWGGYVVQGQGRRFYFAGDTAFFGGFRTIGERFPGIDAALLPIGAYDPQWFMRKQHMNPDDAVAAFRDLGARLLCAMHWGTFKLTDEPLDEPPRLLEEARQREGIAADQVWVAAIGETRDL
ncbi:MAG TPA: MBL fold metallo-hydrolase [Haliangium sp.]|nr:MBL fold metallo-hydrolase [Haliangium sp.]